MPGEINKIEDSNGNSSETTNIKEIQEIKLPTLKEGKTWSDIGEKLVQASFIQKPLEALKEINDSLISTMNDNFDVLNNDITTLKKEFDTLNNSMKEIAEKNSIKLTAGNFEENTLLCDEVWA